MAPTRRYEGITLRLLGVPDRYLPFLTDCARALEVESGAHVEIDRALTWWHLQPSIDADLAAASPRYDLFCNDVEFQYTLRGELLPLNPLLEARGITLDDLFAPVRRYSLSPPDEPGVHYGVPLRVRVPLVFCRTDVIGQLPATWEEYDRALAAAGGSGRSALAFAGGYNEQTAKLWLARYWAAGEALLAPDGAPRIASEAGVEALARLLEQTRRHAPPEVHGWDHEYAGQMFREGRVALLEGLAHPTLDGIEEPRFSNVAGRWSVGAYPGRGMSVFTHPHLVIFRRTRHPEAAFDFIARATAPESCRRLLFDEREFTARRSIWHEAERDGAAQLAPAAQMARIAAALERGVPFLPWVPQWLEMLRALWAGVAACLGGRVEPRPALEGVARTWTELIAARPLGFDYRE